MWCVMCHRPLNTPVPSTLPSRRFFRPDQIKICDQGLRQFACWWSMVLWHAWSCSGDGYYMPPCHLPALIHLSDSPEIGIWTIAQRTTMIPCQISLTLDTARYLKTADIFRSTPDSDGSQGSVEICMPTPAVN